MNSLVSGIVLEGLSTAGKTSVLKAIKLAQAQDAEAERSVVILGEHYSQQLQKIHGKEVKTPRWQMPYGKDYHFSGNTYEAVAVPDMLVPIHNWCKENIYDNLNGLLLNWYDGDLKHYIGKHRDSTRNMILDAPIVTISLGDERVFRLRPYGEKGMIDFPAPHGTIFVLPYSTNKAFTHEVPHFQKFRGRRVSITLRGFK